jgi:DNA-binding NarL/FixJ family response regulator
MVNHPIYRPHQPATAVQIGINTGYDRAEALTFSMPQLTRILLVDDHDIVRAGLAQYIAEHDDLTVAAEAANGDEAISLVGQADFDVVVLDISMPDKNGIDTLRVIRQIKPGIRVLVLSGFPETHYAINMLRAGSNGYVCKDSEADEIIRAIRTVAHGRQYLSEAAADLASHQLKRPSEKMLHETLSEREFQIFRKLAAGQNPTSIAHELKLSVKTVSTYRARVLEKMGLKNNADLTYYAVKNALLD